MATMAGSTAAAPPFMATARRNARNSKVVFSGFGDAFELPVITMLPIAVSYCRK
jgi:hypothetical protein